MTDRCRRTRPGPLVALTFALAALLAARPVAQSLPIAVEVPGGHVLWQVDEVTRVGAPATGVLQMLPLALDGAARRDRLRPDLAREIATPVQAVRLPAAGSLYRVREAGATSLLLARPDGSLQTLIARADGGALPALLEGVAVSPDGASVLVATTPAAGGDVLLVDTAPGGRVTDLTAAEAPLTVAPGSLRLGPDDAWFLAGGQPWHATSDVPPPGGQVAHEVPLALDPGEALVAETVLAADGRTLAVVGEITPEARHLHVVDDAGATVRLTAAPEALDLPSLDAPTGPLLALSEDGAHAAWRSTLLLKKELFTRPTTLGGTPTQITGDLQFADTIDNVGVVGFTDGTVLVFAAGETNPDGIGSADLFRVDLALGTAPGNITGTSGQAAPPFDQPGTLEIFEVTAFPGNAALVLDVDPPNGDHGVIFVPVDGLALPHVVLTDLVAAPQLVPAGDRVVVFSEPDLPGFPRRVHLIQPDGTPTLLADVPGAAGLVIDRTTVDRGGTRVGFVAGFSPGVELPGMIDTSVPSIGAAWLNVMGVSPGVAWSPLGRLAAGVGAGGGPWAWVGFSGFSTGVLYGVPVRRGFPLEL